LSTLGKAAPGIKMAVAQHYLVLNAGRRIGGIKWIVASNINLLGVV
jgi:hypothetical protein